MEAKKTILWLYYFFLGLMLVSLSFSGYYMSVAQFGLVGVMLLDGMKKAEYDDFVKRNNLFIRIIIFLPTGLWWILKAVIKKSGEFFQRENAPAWIFEAAIPVAFGLIAYRYAVASGRRLLCLYRGEAPCS